MCGIIGMMCNQQAVQELYDGLIVLQHRGQDAAGIATFDGRHINIRKANGLVRDVFQAKHIMQLTGRTGIGHCRYPTAGCDSVEEAQPFYVNAPYGIALAHNGNLTNYEKLKEEVVETNRRHLNTKSDSEVLLNILAFELMSQVKKSSEKLNPEKIFKAMKQVFKRLEGGYAVVAMISGIGLLAFRDPYGIRPLIVGTRNTGGQTEYVVASESVALQTLGFKIWRDVGPGEAVFIDRQRKIHTKQCVPGKLQPCLFELVYLARPDSLMDKVSVYKTRLRMGSKLVKQIKKDKLKIDVVIPIPDTSRHIAITLAHELKVKYREGFIKNRYIGRTFIMPNQETRKKSIRYKLNPIPLEFKGKNVLLIDDSIVRGNTSRKIIEMTREAGAKKVYFASAAPPIVNPDVYGIDMPTRGELIAHNMTIEEIGQSIGADKLYYQTYEDLQAAAREGNPKIKKFTAPSMGGPYPVGNITEAVLQRVEASRNFYDNEVVENQMTLL
jgi:amidophosphoribosyltransferase